MADFFSGLNNGNIRQPDALFGPGPLPSTGNVKGDPDGRYNDSGGLLSGISPYDGPKGGRMGSDRNYQQIPHRMQHIVHMLYLPYADKKQRELVGVSHAVDQGDIAFVLNTNRIQGLLYNEVLQRDAAISQAKMPSRNAFANLPTVNYLLAGLQRLDKSDDVSLPWRSLAMDFGYNPAAPDRLRAVLALLREVFVPYGICAGSENQGGKHETGLAPVQSAVNHVTTMTVDGQNRDLVNYWRRSNVGAGDQLIFRLEYLPTHNFTLNHYYKGTVHQAFPDQQWCWQVVPDVFAMTYDPARYDNRPRLQDEACLSYDYRLHGYWRIGQVFQHRGKHDIETQNYSNDLCFLRGQLLQITFAPVWCSFEDLPSVRHAKKQAEVAKKSSTGPVRVVGSKGPPRSLGLHGASAQKRCRPLGLGGVGLGGGRGLGASLRGALGGGAPSAVPLMPSGSAAAAAPLVSVPVAPATTSASAPVSTGAAPAAAAGFLQELAAAPGPAPSASAAEGATSAVNVQNPGKVRVKKAKVAVVQSAE